MANAVFTRNRTIGLTLAALLYIGAAAVVYHSIDQAALDRALALPIAVLASMLGLSLANYALRAWRWVYLSNHLRLGVPAGRNCLYYVSGYALTATPGKAGEAVRLWFMKSGHGVGYSRSLPLMLADRVLDLWAVLILVLFSMSGFAAYHWYSVIVALIVVAISIPILFPRILLPLFGAMYRLAPKRARLIARGRRIVRSLANSISPGAYLATLVPSSAGWFAECVAFYLLLLHFDADVSLASAVFVFSFGMLVGAISMLPGGLGSTEATMVILLKALGVDLGTALAATAIIRFTTFWFAVVIGIFCAPAAIGAAQRSSRPALSQPIGSV